MENSSFFREQADRCRQRAEDADPMLQITLETLAIECTAYAEELDAPDDYWFADKAQIASANKQPMSPSSVTRKILARISLVMICLAVLLATLIL